MEPALVLHEAGGEVRRVVFKGKTVSIGRTSDNDFSFPNDAALSRHHLELEREGASIVVRDLGSKNGTSVNGVRLTAPCTLKPGDHITAGRLRIEFRTEDAPTGHTVVFVPHPERAELPPIQTDLDSAMAIGSPAAAGGPAAQKAIETLIRAGRELSTHRPLAELLELILELARDAVEADRGALMLMENGELALRAARGEKFEISTAVRDRVLHERASLLVLNVPADREFGGRLSIVRQRVGSMMAVPLQTKDEVLGLLYVDSINVLHEFSRADLDLLTVLANVAATRIGQIRLAELEEAERAIARELAQAAEIQRQMLPEGPPEFAGVSLAGRNIPCRTVGGDYFDYLRFPDGRLGIVVADVSGKGMPAALLMSSLQARLETLAGTDCGVAGLVTHLNGGIASRCPANRFVTFFIAALDPAGERLSYSNAGHNPPLLLRADGSVERLECGGVPLGMFPRSRYPEGSVEVNRGDTLVLFSDGVTEAARPDADEEFGEERLTEAVRECGGAAPDGIAEHVLEKLTEFNGGPHFADDVTLVIARFGKD